MKAKQFSIIEIAVVLFVILLLMAIGAKFYKTVQRSIMVKNQTIEFEVIKIAINSFKSGNRGTGKAYSKHVSLYDLIYKHSLLSEKRIMIINGASSTATDLEEIKILSYFDTPIEVYVTKQKNSAKQDDIDTALLTSKIAGREYLTGAFEFYFGNDHEPVGGEMGPGPYPWTTSGTPYGLKGNGTIDEGHRYYYRFVYKDYDGREHEYRMH